MSLVSPIAPRPPTRPAGPTPVAVGPVSVTTASGVRLHGIQTGFVAVKAAHYRLPWPAPLRLLRIVADTRWTPALPVLAWLIEHPEGLIVVDTGELAAAGDIGSYMAADPNSAWFFGRNLRFFTTPEEEIAAQLRGLGHDPADVRTLVLTHMHEDHAAGLSFFPNARVLVARAEFMGQRRFPMGAVAALWPRGFAPELVEHAGLPVGPFPASHPITRDGDVVLVPTPGHSYGHQSLIVRDGRRSYFIAGDLAFSAGQLREQGLQGIAQDLTRARASLDRAWRYTQQEPTIFLPSHDPQSLERLARSVEHGA